MKELKGALKGGEGVTDTGKAGGGAVGVEGGGAGGGGGGVRWIRRSAAGRRECQKRAAEGSDSIRHLSLCFPWGRGDEVGTRGKQH